MQTSFLASPILDHVEHLVELGTVIGTAWRVVSIAKEVLDVLKEFPPHRHINGRIAYPKGFEPAVIESLKVENKGA